MKIYKKFLFWKNKKKINKFIYIRHKNISYVPLSICSVFKINNKVIGFFIFESGYSCVRINNIDINKYFYLSNQAIKFPYWS